MPCCYECRWCVFWGFFANCFCHCLRDHSFISHLLLMKATWPFTDESVWALGLSLTAFQLCYCSMSTFIFLDYYFLQAGFVRNACENLFGHRYVFLLFFSYTRPHQQKNKVLDQSKSVGWLFYENLTPLTDSSVWRQEPCTASATVLHDDHRKHIPAIPF